MNSFELAENKENPQFVQISDSQNKSKTEDTMTNNSDFHRKRRKKIKEPLYFSFRHTVHLVTLWIMFLATVIIGFIVHFDTIKNVTASSIMWTFSLILLVFCILYSYNYYKCSKARTEEELQRRLKYFPC